MEGTAQPAIPASRPDVPAILSSSAQALPTSSPSTPTGPNPLPHLLYTFSELAEESTPQPTPQPAPPPSAQHQPQASPLQSQQQHECTPGQQQAEQQQAHQQQQLEVQVELLHEASATQQQPQAQEATAGQQELALQEQEEEEVPPAVRQLQAGLQSDQRPLVAAVTSVEPQPEDPTPALLHAQQQDVAAVHLQREEQAAAVVEAAVLPQTQPAQQQLPTVQQQPQQQATAGALVLASRPSPPATVAVAPWRPVEVEPQITLLHRVHGPAPPEAQQPFWAGFVDKCRRAWDILRPDVPPPVLAPASVVRSRLQMVLVADRCGMLPADLLALKDRTMAAMAEQLDAEGFSEIEVRVSATKANGDRLTLTLPLSSMPGGPGAGRTRDEKLYDFQASSGAASSAAEDDEDEDEMGDEEDEEAWDTEAEEAGSGQFAYGGSQRALQGEAV